MALSFIGKPISLISHSDVRYRGILAGIDPANSTIQLSNVYSMGTESRKSQSEFIPPVQEPYQYIIFRASEVKDLAVDEPAPPRRSVHDDPAVLGASAPGVPQVPYPPYGAPYQQPPVPQPPPSQPQPPVSYPQQSPHIPQEAPQPSPVQNGQNIQPVSDGPSSSNNVRRPNNSVQTATASLETVERALGDLRVANGVSGGRGGRRGHHGQDAKVGELTVPNTEFDFQSANARFDKAALAPKKAKQPEDDKPVNEESPGEKEKEKEERAYNPTKSFFDNLSSSTQSAPPPQRGRRGGGARNRREEERERNVATFGEPGGVGLMGPGAYVGGYGGHGRRGGRLRRGAPPAGNGR
ncbi:Scd6-like Sm domain-containing protein [Pisolithus orientalis]|uniref:Scd6-like Sm domain-containing protein n=1 Tax=Pisolithus orientalis TaxID=936130 RepID=UPI00222435C3|nr:Scd6-like Sm domain-containing protein [Pisolithus orientalis]KAI6028752.1 Scd6-like Sm domain-containing protein [Pisolithus orientalis]